MIGSAGGGMRTLSPIPYRKCFVSFIVLILGVLPTLKKLTVIPQNWPFK